MLSFALRPIDYGDLTVCSHADQSCPILPASSQPPSTLVFQILPAKERNKKKLSGISPSSRRIGHPLVSHNFAGEVRRSVTYATNL
jgi:hypothetical protein